MQMAQLPQISCCRRDYETDKFPAYSQPMQVGHFSVTQDGSLYLDDRNCMHLRHFTQLPYKVPRPGWDLNAGFAERQEYTYKYEDAEIGAWARLDDLLQYLIAEADAKQSDLCSVLGDAQIVAYRGLLQRIASSICSQSTHNDVGWCVVARKYGDYIFLSELLTAAKVRSRASETKRQKQMGYWGYKFEQFMQTRKSDGAVELEPVCNHEQYNVVYRVKLDGVRILFAAEMDAIDATTGKYVEFKTQRVLDNKKTHENFYRYKADKWWMQSFLAGIERILVGYRTDDGYTIALHNSCRVVRVDELRIRDLPKTAARLAGEASRTWVPATCMNYLAKFLQFLVEWFAVGEHSDKIIRLEWIPGNVHLDARVISDKEFDRYDFILPEFTARFAL